MRNKYYKTFDFFNMKSKGGLHIISHFKTMMQTTDYTCAPVCAIMVLSHLGITPPR